jgi:methylenetetrahydrofolate reductase (NADPH)
MRFPWRRKPAGLTEEQRAALKRLVADAKFELIPLASVMTRCEALPDGASVTVTASPSHGIEATFELSEALASRGHEVTPHLSARMIRDRVQLTDLMDRAREAGLRRVFVVGGDSKDAGDFADGLSLLRAMDESGHPFEEIGVPAYPEGHVEIPDDVLFRVLHEKQRYAQAMTTQMCFNPSALSDWLTRMRVEGIVLPLYLGTPGVAELTKLMTISARIGIADSARYLRKNKRMVGALIKKGSFGPDAFLRGLAPTLADPVADVQGLHVFTFNQVADTASWQRRMLEALGA